MEKGGGGKVTSSVQISSASLSESKRNSSGKLALESPDQSKFLSRLHVRGRARVCVLDWGIAERKWEEGGRKNLVERAEGEMRFLELFRHGRKRYLYPHERRGGGKNIQKNL